MARKGKGGPAGAGSGGRTVRVSVVMEADDHKRLAALALASDRTINQTVLDAVLPKLADVRVPWVVGPGRTEDAA